MMCCSAEIFAQYINDAALIAGHSSKSSSDAVAMECDTYLTDSFGIMSLGVDNWQGFEASRKVDENLPYFGPYPN